MGRGQISHNVYVSIETHHKLKLFAAISDQHMSDVVDDAINQYINDNMDTRNDIDGAIVQLSKDK